MVTLWTIRLFVQVHRHWVHYTLARRYENHNCHDKPQIGNGVGVWITSCPEEMGWDFGDLKKGVSWKLTSGNVRQTFYLCHLGHRELSSLPWSQEFGVDCGPESWDLTSGHVRQMPLGIENWVLCHGVESWKVGFGHVDRQLKLGSDHGVEMFGFRPLRHTVKMKGDLKLREMCRAFEFC